MTNSEILITGASGEIGHGLLRYLSEEGGHAIVGTDKNDPDETLAPRFSAFYKGDITDPDFIAGINSRHRFHSVFHLAGLLSRAGEENPFLAHAVNVNGSLNLLKLAQDQSNQRGVPVIFMFTSSIAVYGLMPGDANDRTVGIEEFLTPRTVYGINKLYIEQLGQYFSKNFRPQASRSHVPLDFRALRFPGLISPDTVPTGGTTDYAPEMIHAAAQGRTYSCFVEASSKLPFMVMPDGIKALVMLSRAASAKLRHQVYNVSAFSVSAEQFRQKTLEYFSHAQIIYDVKPARQAIVDSWPCQVDDVPARRDWGWHPEFDLDRAYETLLIPGLKRRYPHAMNQLG